tara:strand:- start:761 stop:883 length:123 start_codon:yes stop_codon:yes gene_type:complete
MKVNDIISKDYYDLESFSRAQKKYLGKNNQFNFYLKNFYL